ncbi:cyclin-D-binding Myb-like transcription factor 1 [Canna indica]|uniref:Cyclin-D-binding Myb-like transcription factor 1 n=1 Tax=Canna indica TaxID=4628 RepID=A0AAQ3L311_9LILI|nr:cyclin-D-binding Myb-like transcription factor 1 [Canna indica]
MQNRAEGESNEPNIKERKKNKDRKKKQHEENEKMDNKISIIKEGSKDNDAKTSLREAQVSLKKHKKNNDFEAANDQVDHDGKCNDVRIDVENNVKEAELERDSSKDGKKKKRKNDGDDQKKMKRKKTLDNDEVEKDSIATLKDGKQLDMACKKSPEDYMSEIPSNTISTNKKRKISKGKDEKGYNQTTKDPSKNAVNVEDKTTGKSVQDAEAAGKQKNFNVSEASNPKKKMKEPKNGSDTSALNKKKKKVSFSNEIKVFPAGIETNAEKNAEGSLVQGKRFTPEEDNKIKEAIDEYIQKYKLGEEGMHMIVNCKKYPQMRNCWKEIGTCLPYRPYKALYYRAHVLLERSEKRTWEPEEYEIVRRYHATHGADWKTLAVQLGKHRVHLKDCWRRIKLPNARKGPWSQDEYQNLFNLVNLDLRMKASEKKESKHGMLRDNISWEAIGDKLTTRISSVCCLKWYKQLTSPLVKEGLWADADDYRMLDALQKVDACCVEDVDWDNLLEHRSGEICQKRWKQMARHIGGFKERPFIEQVEVLSKRYGPEEMIKYREMRDKA